MAHYFVGDLQGCYKEFRQLLNIVDFNPSTDEIWAVGDLIARGPDSLNTLRFFAKQNNAAKTVLGNHDLHFLAVANGLKIPKAADKLEQLLAADDLGSLIEFVRHQPLMRELPEHQLVMTHAGVPPQWDLTSLRHESNKVAQALTQDNYLSDLIGKMYGSEVDAWHPNMSELHHWIYCINALTRMRYLHLDGRLDFACKQPPNNQDNQELKPWFEFPSALPSDTKIIFGHWAALMGQTNHANYLALDTGCCWGEYLTLYHLEKNEKITQPTLR